MSKPFDLSRYFARIGYDGPATPTLDVLRRLHLLHPQAIPFENLDPLTGARVALDVPAVVAKLVERRRGGYCFEQNKLFHAALTQIGFRVTPLIARVRWQRPADTATAQTHMLLRIDVDGEAWIADVGFGGATLTAPLRSTPAVRQTTPHGVFRLVETELPDEIVCEFETANGWQPVYRFSGKPVEWVDYDAANWFTSTFPDSRFLHDLIACRVLPDGRATLVNTVLTVRDGTGQASTLRFDDAGAWEACLRETLHIDPAGFDVAALFERLAVRGDTFAAGAPAASGAAGARS
ncbi:Arylamine N-acetyltransferase [Burkholderia multivorans]